MTNIRLKNKHSPSIRHKCLACKNVFTPDPRVGSRQKYCSRKECQSKRQRANENTWREDPENHKFLEAQWRGRRASHPDYLKQWRQEHPESVRRNRESMREYQRRRRQGELFETGKEIVLQVIKDKGVVYASRGNTWILMRLKQAGRWTKALRVGYASKRIRSGPVHRPQGRLYDVSSAFK